MIGAEAWVPVPGYAYEVSSLGRVRRILPGGATRLVAQTIVKKRRGEYLRVDLWRWNRRKHFTVHRLVAAAFLPLPRPGQIEVNHVDTDSCNNTWDNLEWATRRENEQHKQFWRACDELALAASGGSD